MTLRPTTLLVTVATVIGLVAAGCSANDDERSDGSPLPASADPIDTIGTLPTARDTAATSTPPTSSATSESAAATTDGDVALGTPPARIDTVLDADEFAARLSASHAAMVDITAPDDERARAGIEYQLVLRVLADRPDLDEQVLGALDPTARPAVERIVRARQFLQQRTASRPPQPLPPELPAWTVVEPEPIATLRAHYAEAEQLTGVAWYWLAAIHLQETRMGRIQGVSSAGAVGPMQFLPTTWAVCCTGDPTVTRDAIIGAATYLAQSGAPDDMAAALFQYNPNDGYVAVVTAYAESLRDEPELFTGYHAFQVFFGSSAGTVRLPIGYSETTPVDAAEFLAANPQHAA